MKLKFNKQIIKKKKQNTCNKMQRTENSQDLISDLKEKAIRRISEVQNYNTYDKIKEDSKWKTETGKVNPTMDIGTKQTSFNCNSNFNLENKIHNILFVTILRFIVCVAVLFAYVYNLLSLPNEF